MDQSADHRVHRLLSLTTLATLLYVPRMTAILRAQPALFGVVVLLVLAVANLPREIHRERDGGRS